MLGDQDSFSIRKRGKRQSSRLALAGRPWLAFELVPGKVDSLQFLSWS
uniref:Uncharacterized protein n=1 Tax=Arundo donax TaxID=35708 RepID=A0A0A8YHH1_ARUDO